MRFTLFTPTHNPKFLERLAISIKNQKFKDYEWVIVPNGDAKMQDIADFPVNKRIIKYTGNTKNIGEIKAFCCEQAQGEILVEVDHDDEITMDCLEELNKAFEDPSVDFVYSNCCEIRNGQPNVYDKIYGWEFRPFNYNGNPLLELVAFPPDPASFSKIWYAPNHVRAWRASFYEKIGGHDKSLDILDDHDLLCRTYINGNVKHLDKCLYVYHFHQDNTSTGEKNAKIQVETLNIHDKYLYPMVEKWCDLNGLRKIDLGGKLDSPQGYESVDLENASIVCDLNEKWPFADGSVGVFRAHDIIEHLKNPIHVMQEAYRCLAPNGWFLILVPSAEGRGAFMDPTHCSYWVSTSFWYYCKREQNRYINCPVRFQANRIKDFFPSQWHEFHKIPYVKADLLKHSGRTPGLMEI